MSQQYEFLSFQKMKDISTIFVSFIRRLYIYKRVNKTSQHKLASKLKHYTLTLGFLPDASNPSLRFMPPPVPV
jgi:hypothetical protein